MSKYDTAKYDNMSKEELSNELDKLTDLHEEILEEREIMIYGTTGLHRTVGHLIEKYAKELGELKAAIDFVRDKLHGY